MKKVSLFIVASLLSAHALGADSVYSWGPWAQGIKPAAGGTAAVTPPPAQAPDIQFRPNENAAFFRSQAPAVFTQPVVDTTTSEPDVMRNTPPYTVALPPPAPMSAPKAAL